MSEDKRQVSFRVSPEEEEKLERMRRGSRRPSIQSVLSALVAMADPGDPIWNIALQEHPAPAREAQAEPQ